MRRGLWLLCLGFAATAQAAWMSEVRFSDQEADAPAVPSRYLILGERMRLDFGDEAEDFILFDRRGKMLWLVSHRERRLTGTLAHSPRPTAAPKDWKVNRERLPSGMNSVTQVRLNDRLCVEFKSAPIHQEEARMLRDYRRALAQRQARERKNQTGEPCALLLEQYQAGLEYQSGMPLAIRYGDGRLRLFQGLAWREARPELFELPAGYRRVVVSPASGR